MAVRVISSIIGFPLLAVIVILGGIYLKIGILAVALIGLYEFYMAVSKEIKFIHITGFLMTIIYICFIDYKLGENLRLIFYGFILLMLIILVVMHSKINILDVCITLFGFFYIPFMITNIYLIRNTNLGQFNVWLAFICAWCCDTGAYFIGVNFGKHKITPVLSPNKTVEGALGGVISSGAGALIYGVVINKFFVASDINIAVIFGIIGLVGSVFAQFGDLAASSIKRYTKIKDYGKIIPGHGGILDRFDSVLFTAPIVYILVKIIIK